MVAVTAPSPPGRAADRWPGRRPGWVGLELGQQSPAVAGAHAGGLGQPGTGDGLASGDQGGIGGAGAHPLALPGGLLVLDVGGRLGDEGWSAGEQAEHGEAAEQPHRGRPGRQVADQGGWGDRHLEQGGQGHGGDQQQPRQPQHGPMPQALGLQHADLHGQGQGLGAQRPQLGDGPPAGAGGGDHGPVGLHQQHAGDEADDHGQDALARLIGGRPLGRRAGWPGR
jgi:hypothetical protein